MSRYCGKKIGGTANIGFKAFKCVMWLKESYMSAHYISFLLNSFTIINMTLAKARVISL